MKLRYLLFVVGIIFFSFSVWYFISRGNSSNQVSDVRPGSITSTKFDTTFVDVGKQKWKVPVQTSFVVYNTGAKDLYIQKVAPDCHCTSVDFSHDPIHPQGSSIIKLTFDASNIGPFQVSATAYTNTVPPATLLVFRGVIEK